MPPSAEWIRSCGELGTQTPSLLEIGGADPASMLGMDGADVAFECASVAIREWLLCFSEDTASYVHHDGVERTNADELGILCDFPIDVRVVFASQDRLQEAPATIMDWIRQRGRHKPFDVTVGIAGSPETVRLFRWARGPLLMLLKPAPYTVDYTTHASTWTRERNHDPRLLLLPDRSHARFAALEQVFRWHQDDMVLRACHPVQTPSGMLPEQVDLAGVLQDCMERYDGPLPADIIERIFCLATPAYACIARHTRASRDARSAHYTYPSASAGTPASNV